MGFGLLLVLTLRCRVLRKAFSSHASSQPHRQFTIRPLKDEIKDPEHDEQSDQENDTDNPTQNLEHVCLRCLL